VEQYNIVKGKLQASTGENTYYYRNINQANNKKLSNDNNSNNNSFNSILSVLYYLCAVSTAVRPITDTGQFTRK
jgi:hypothetical protein